MDHLAPIFLKEIQLLIGEQVIDQCLVTRYQKKRYEQSYDFVLKSSVWIYATVTLYATRGYVFKVHSYFHSIDIRTNKENQIKGELQF